MQPEQQRTPLWTRPFIALTICFFLLFLSLQMLLSSFPAYVKAEFHTGNVQASLVTSVFALAAILSRFATAALMPHISRMKLLLAGLVIAAATTALYSLAGSFTTLLLLRIGYGIGFGMASTILPTLVSRIIPLRRMGEGIGYFGLSTSLAMSIGPSIGLNVMKQAGFMPLTMIGLITSVVIFPVLWLSRSKQDQAAVEQMKPDADSDQQGVQSKPAAKPGFNRKWLFPVLLNVFLSITYSGLLSFLALFGDYVHIEQVGLFFLFNAITIILVRPFSGRIFDRFGHASVLIPAGLFVTASMVVLSHAHAMPMLIVSALLYGAGFGAIQPTIQAWMLRSSKPEQYGMANSMFYNSTDFGVAVGAILLGAISSVTNYSVMYSYSAGVMAVFVILGTLQYVIATKRHFRVLTVVKNYTVMLWWNKNR
ncbi:MFS transporter [Paenibacillus qinlingensis]|uniref:MFS family arabinose efflux permease n=1 Tax=Paenibacillus qinlingensis TaxID=1837343 RepID=A0ABU1NP27_9BACL|nr:MFS transporter [Paenibacillus qinlingensis]MDR6549163.1 putative MFS family arabinose efflux permease [Paenibacillus qinlingensis]